MSFWGPIPDRMLYLRPSPTGSKKWASIKRISVLASFKKPIQSECSFLIPLLGAIFSSSGASSLEKTKCLRQRSQTCRASQNMGAIFPAKKCLRQRRQMCGASTNMGTIFLKEKNVCGNVVRHVWLSKIWGPFFWGINKPLRQRTQTCRASRKSCMQTPY